MQLNGAEQARQELQANCSGSRITDVIPPSTNDGMCFLVAAGTASFPWPHTKPFSLIGWRLPGGQRKPTLNGLFSQLIANAGDTDVRTQESHPPVGFQMTQLLAGRRAVCYFRDAHLGTHLNIWF